MSSDRSDPFTMIGLHKLAAQCGDGLVPELYTLLSRRSQMLEDNANVAEFPVWQTQPSARAPLGIAPEPQDNILAFPSVSTMAVSVKDRA